MTARTWRSNFVGCRSAGCTNQRQGPDISHRADMKNVQSDVFSEVLERMHARFVVFRSPDNLEKRGGEIEMMVEPKRNPPPEDHDRANRDRRHQEEALDEALKNTFPASDPFSVEQLSRPPRIARSVN